MKKLTIIAAMVLLAAITTGCSGANHSKQVMLPNYASPITAEAIIANADNTDLAIRAASAIQYLDEEFFTLLTSNGYVKNCEKSSCASSKFFVSTFGPKRVGIAEIMPEIKSPWKSKDYITSLLRNLLNEYDSVYFIRTTEGEALLTVRCVRGQCE